MRILNTGRRAKNPAAGSTVRAGFDRINTRRSERKPTTGRRAYAALLRGQQTTRRHTETIRLRRCGRGRRITKSPPSRERPLNGENNNNKKKKKTVYLKIELSYSSVFVNKPPPLAYSTSSYYTHVTLYI